MKRIRNWNWHFIIFWGAAFAIGITLWYYIIKTITHFLA